MEYFLEYYGVIFVKFSGKDSIYNYLGGILKFIFFIFLSGL